MSKRLKLVAADIVFNSELTKPAKLQMLNFIKEDASDVQIKALLMDGDIVQVDNLSESIINARFTKYEKMYENKAKLLQINFSESQNITDSILFLLSARTSLINIIEADRENTSAQKREMVDFLVNEASDYQIMHLLLCNDLPKNKYDPVAEEMLYRDFKESMLINKNFVTELVGPDIFNNILYEVASLSSVTSSQLPILEFGRQNDSDIDYACLVFSEELFSAYGHYLTEKPRWKDKAAGHLKGAWDKTKGLRTDVASGARTVGTGLAGAGKEVASGAQKGSLAAKRAFDMKFGKQGKVAAAIGSRGGGIPDRYISSLGADKAAALKARTPGARVVKALKGAAGKASDAAKRAGTAIKGAAGKAAGAGRTAAGKAADVGRAAVGAGRTAAGKAVGAGRTAAGRAGTAISGAAGKAGALAGRAAAAGTKFATTPAGMAVGGAAAAALAIYAGYKIYKRFFSQAAKACSNAKGAEKTACMQKFRKQAIIKQIAATQGGMGKCSKTKNPEACKNSIAQKVNSLKAKAAKIAG